MIFLFLLANLSSLDMFTGDSINPYIIDAIAFVESSYREDAVSSAGAFGIFQLRDIACADVGIDCSNRSDVNKQYEAMQLFLKRWYKVTGCTYTTLDIYNRGRGNQLRNKWTKDWQAHPYVGKILAFINERKEKQDKDIEFYKNIDRFEKRNDRYVVVYNN